MTKGQFSLTRLPQRHSRFARDDDSIFSSLRGVKRRGNLSIIPRHCESVSPWQSFEWCLAVTRLPRHFVPHSDEEMGKNAPREGR